MKCSLAFIVVARHLFQPFVSLKEAITFLQEIQIDLSENGKVLDVSAQFIFFEGTGQADIHGCSKMQFIISE